MLSPIRMSVRPDGPRFRTGKVIRESPHRPHTTHKLLTDDNNDDNKKPGLGWLVRNGESCRGEGDGGYFSPQDLPRRESTGEQNKMSQRGLVLSSVDYPVGRGRRPEKLGKGLEPVI